MSGTYPDFQSCYTHEEMAEHFLLTRPIFHWFLPAAGMSTAVAWPCCSKRCLTWAASRKVWTEFRPRCTRSSLHNWAYYWDHSKQPLIEALAIIQKYLHTHYESFPGTVPIEGVVTPKWHEKVLEKVENEVKVNRSYYELCVLEKLERALKCKEVWVEGSHAFRNPGDDLPGDWGEENRRTLHYQELGKPVDAHTFVESLRERLTRALEQFNRVLPSVGHLRIFHPNKKENRGLWALTKLEPQPEPQSVGLIKDEISNHYGMLDLLDVFVEADRLVDFTRFFTHSDTKEVRSRETLRPLLILDLFAEGTNTGIKRAANANDRYSYEELLYVRKTYFSPEALRNANGAVVNKLLALRNPRIWGEGASSWRFRWFAFRELEAEPHDGMALALHFRGGMQGTEIDIPQGGSPPTTLAASGNLPGIATLFGQFSFRYQLTVTLATATATGSATLVTINGDTISTIIAGELEATTTPGVSSITEIDIITGGTGRFAGAKGSFTVERLINPPPGERASHPVRSTGPLFSRIQSTKTD